MTTTSVTVSVGNYVDSLWYGTHDSSGYLVGGTATAPVAGDQDGSFMARLKGVQTFPFQPQAADRPNQPGDGGVLARFINKPTELPEADITMGASDYTFDALAESSAVVTLGGGRLINRQGYNPTFNDLIFLVTSPAKSIATGNEGSMWEGRLIYSVNAQARGRDAFDTGSLPTYGLSLVANFASSYPWGTAFVAGTDGDTQFVYSDFTWPYRPILGRFTLDGSETTFNLAYNIAEDSANNVVALLNGTALTWVTGAPSAGEFGITESTTDTLVLGGAGTTADKLVVLMGWS